MNSTLALAILGIVVAIVVGAWQIYLAWRQIQIAKHQSKKAHSPLTEGDTSDYKERPYPSEIRDAINELPPAQRNAAASNYVGLRVKWRVKLYDVTLEPRNIARLMMLDRGNYPWIYCEVDVRHYPELKIVKTGHQLWVIGEISKVYGNNIDLVKSEIRLD